MSDADNQEHDLPLPTPADPPAALPDMTEPAVAAPVEAIAAETAAGDLVGHAEEAAVAPQFAPPATEPPTEQFAAQHFPTEQIPAAAAPTVPMPSMTPAPSSVVLSANAPAAPKKKGVLAWALAGIAAIAAIVFAILWVGKSGDADDLTTERNALVAEKGTLEGELATANSDLESTKGELESATSDLDAATAKAEDLQSEIDGLSTQVDDLTAELEAAQDQPATGTKAADYAPRLSLGLGQALGANADPALSDDEALCLGSNLIDIAGIDLVFGDYFEEIELTEDEANRFGRAFILAAASCGIEFTRLNL